MRGSRNCRRGGGGGGGGAAWKSRHTTAAWEKWTKSSTDSEEGAGGSGHPGKSHIIWGSIGNKQWNPIPGKIWTPPPPPPKPGKSSTPSGTLKNVFFEMNHLTSVQKS